SPDLAAGVRFRARLWVGARDSGAAPCRGLLAGVSTARGPADTRSPAFLAQSASHWRGHPLATRTGASPQRTGNGSAPVLRSRPGLWEEAMTQEIDIKAADGVQVIRFLRADKKNAFTGPMYAAMSQALEAAETDDSIAAHVFIGSGGVFSAGNDINDFLRRAQATVAGDGPGIP